MAIPVRINEDNYVTLKKRAVANRRSVISEVNSILDEVFGRSTVGDHSDTIVVSNPPNVMNVIEPDPDSKKITAEPSAHSLDNVFGAPTPIEQLDEIDGLIAQGETVLDTRGKQYSKNIGTDKNGVVVPDHTEVAITTPPACCLQVKKPCKHWQFNGADGVWENTITGEIKEVPQ